MNTIITNEDTQYGSFSMEWFSDSLIKFTTDLMKPACVCGRQYKGYVIVEKINQDWSVKECRLIDATTKGMPIDYGARFELFKTFFELKEEYLKSDKFMTYLRQHLPCSNPS